MKTPMTFTKLIIHKTQIKKKIIDVKKMNLEFDYYDYDEIKMNTSTGILAQKPWVLHDICMGKHLLFLRSKQ